MTALRTAAAHKLPIFVAIVVAGAGCGPHMRMPRWFDPGNTATQRYEAIYHDPYLLPDVGPEVVGARPRAYQAPVPPVLRAQAGKRRPTVTPPTATPRY